jgi:prepilin peptidase CpaA
MHFIYPIGFIVLGFVLFVFHVMGAGDSKYLASLFLVTPTPFHPLLMEKLLTVTIFVGTILIILKFVKSAEKIRVYLMTFHLAGLKSEISSRFSFAPVILVSWILYGVSLWH